ncbi:MAG: DUF721 domain-containing protein [bacterium]
MSHVNNKNPGTLGDSISQLLKSLGIEKKVKQHEVVSKWPEIVGKKVASVTNVEKVVDGILFIKVISSAWRNELIYMKKDILQRMNKTFGAGIIKDIRFI